MVTTRGGNDKGGNDKGGNDKGGNDKLPREPLRKDNLSGCLAGAARLYRVRLSKIRGRSV